MKTTVVIIGAGPSGIAAAIYLRRYNIDFVILSQNIGGQMLSAGIVENYPGITSTTGAQLTDDMINNLNYLNINVKFAEVIKLEKRDIWNVYCNGFSNTFLIECSAILICTGRKYKKLPIEGIDEWNNKGLSFCATCDGALYKDKNVAVIGGGNSALDAALILSSIANHVTVINKNNIFKGEHTLKEQVCDKSNVSILYNKHTVNVTGDECVEQIHLQSGEIIKVDGVFVAIGTTPNTTFLSSLPILNSYGEIEISPSCATAVDGIFAAGDVTNTFLPQIIIASGAGAQAAMTIRSWLHL